jgi:quercetin dioxygenase-like cupin family protein
MGTGDDRSAAAERVEFAPGLWRTDLQQQDLSIPGREVIQSRVDIDPEAPAVRHTHPGEEIIYVLDGRWSIRSKASRRGRSTPVTP